MAYTDLFLVPLQKKNLTAYKKLARRFGVIIRDLGALEYREFAQDAIDPKFLKALGKSVDLKTGEIVIFAYIDFPSKATRVRAYKKMMTDARMKKMMAEKPIFDSKRMIYGGFKQIYKMAAKKRSK